LNNHRAVVQRPTRLEYRAQQIAGNNGVQIHSAFGERPQTDFALNHNQGADLPLRQMSDRQQNLLRRLAPF